MNIYKTLVNLFSIYAPSTNFFRARFRYLKSLFMSGSVAVPRYLLALGSLLATQYDVGGQSYQPCAIINYDASVVLTLKVV